MVLVRAGISQPARRCLRLAEKKESERERCACIYKKELLGTDQRENGPLIWGSGMQYHISLTVDVASRNINLPLKDTHQLMIS